MRHIRPVTTRRRRADLTARAAALALALLAATPADAAPQGVQVPHAGPERSAWAPVDPALAFLWPYGLGNFPPQYVDALQTFLAAEERYGATSYGTAQTLLDTLFAAHPTGGADWGALPGQPFGINVGTPTGYYGLRMLDDMTDWRLASGVVGSDAPRTARLTVVLVGETTGVEPQSLLELVFGLGVPAVKTLDPAVEADGHAVVHQSLELFREYVFFMTDGLLDVETHFLSLPDLSLPFDVSILPTGSYHAGLADFAQVWGAVPEDVQVETDWWWILYPSCVPEQYPDFTTTEFITGGIGHGPDGLSPAMVIDDRWLLRKPPHLGQGPYSEIERRAYLPQWLQHEFFHHLFARYPEFGLEATPHQWFDPATWPADFVGTYEADYYHEALFKRLMTAEPPLHVALRYATADAPWDELVLGDVLAEYRREPVENDWHIGTISQVSGNELRWTNQAGVSWGLDAELASGTLWTGPDCPYYDPPSGTKFGIHLARDEMGDLTSEVEGFVFNGEVYWKQ